MADVSGWSQTDASNNTASPAGFPEGMAPSGVNDSARAIMGALKRWHDQISPTITSGGAANVQTLTYAVAPAAYAFGDRFSFFAGFDTNSTATLNVNGLGAKPLVNANGSTLTGGEIRAGDVVEVAYDNASFRILGRRRQFLSANGNYYLPGGLILQWGLRTFAGTSTAAVVYLDPFPSETLLVLTDIFQTGGSSLISSSELGSWTANGFIFTVNTPTSNTGIWLALGH